MGPQENAERLVEMGIEFKVYNNGYQFNIDTEKGIISFYPTTNKWVLKGKTYKGDADRLIAFIYDDLEDQL